MNTLDHPNRPLILHERPPVWDRCIEVFGRAQLEDKPVVFAWGMTIYNPTGAQLPRTLIAHEHTHGERQLAAGDVEAWWERYLTDPLFRLDEEIYAHHAEYQAFKRRHGHRPRDLNMIAERLSSPLYGRLVTLEQAKHAILTGEVR